MKPRKFVAGGYNGELGPDQNINQPDIDVARKKAAIAAAINKPVARPSMPPPLETVQTPARVAIGNMQGLEGPPSAAEVEMPTPRPREAMGGMKGMPGRVVSKAELAKSGMSLRDFLNKERGLKRRPEKSYPKDTGTETFLKRGGSVKAYASGGSVSSRADGCAQRGKTRGMMR